MKIVFSFCFSVTCLMPLTANASYISNWTNTVALVARASTVMSLIKFAAPAKQRSTGHVDAGSNAELTNTLRTIAQYDTASIRLGVAMSLANLTDRDIMVLFLLNRFLFVVPDDVMNNSRNGNLYQRWYTSATPDAPFLKQEKCGCLSVSRIAIAGLMTGFSHTNLLRHFDTFATTFPRRGVDCSLALYHRNGATP